MSVVRFSDREASAGARAQDGLIGRSPLLREALDRLERVAPTDTTVLITGETGTGKELVARSLHRRSLRAGQALVAVHLGAIPETLVAAELFGHEAGAFTGAAHRRLGRFESADRGTLFLDEAGELSPGIQVALLRALEEGRFERLGASQTRHADVRLIAATHRDLAGEVEQGRFRADLFYRLSVFPIRLPPLRERAEDVPMLAQHFLRGMEKRLGRSFDGIEGASLEALAAFSWPGNVRQLENVIEHSAILCDSPVLRVPPAALERRDSQGGAAPLNAALRQSEQQLIEAALLAAAGRVSGRAGAAARLGLPASTLESKIRKLKIDKLRYRTARRPSDAIAES